MSLSPTNTAVADDPEARARRRMISFLRFIRSQEFFVRSHRMEAHESPDPAFTSKCEAMNLLREDAPRRCLLDVSHDRTSARLGMALLALMILFIFWLDFFADEEGGVLVTSAAFHLAMLLLVAFTAIRVALRILRRDRLLFTEDTLFICRHGLFGWRVSTLSRRSVKDVVTAGRGRRIGVRRLLAERDDGAKRVVIAVDDDATVEWMRWVLLCWLGRVYAEEQDEATADAAGVAEAVVTPPSVLADSPAAVIVKGAPTVPSSTDALASGGETASN